jgi:hypothetical protein
VTKINHQFLVELGLGHLDEREQVVISRRIYDVLEMRVGLALVSSLTKSQQDIFENVMSESPEEAQAYLSSVVPNYAAVARSELEVIATAIAHSVRQGAVVVDAPETNKRDNE